MPQHDLILDNGSGAAFRADANNALAALGSSMKGPNAPPAPISGMMWLDDDTPSASIWTLKMYDGADWIEIGRLNVTTNIFTVAEGSMVGQIALFPANVAPGGWLKANGVILSRATYSSLWAFANASGNIVSDATWAAANGPTGSFSTGDGSTTFRVPDLRGEFLRCWDDARGVDSGRAIGSFQADAMQGHLHQPLTGSTFWGNGGSVGSAQPVGNTFAVTGGTTGTAVTDGTNGTPRTAAETRPLNFALLACIKF